MTLLRRLALRLSTRMVEYAPPSRKEFAAGLAREVEFIPNDWRALAWSLGSVGVLFDRKAAAEDHATDSYSRTLSKLANIPTLMFASLYLMLAVREHDPACRVGFFLLSFCCLYQLGASAVEWLRKNGAPRYDDREGQRLYSRAAIVRRLRRARSIRRWQALLPAVAFGLGLPLTLGIAEHPIRSAIDMAVFLTVGYLLTAFNYSPAKAEAQLARWDARYAQPEAAKQ